MTTRLVSNPWSRVVGAFIDEGVESGEIIVHGGEYIRMAGGGYFWDADELEERRKLATRVIFLHIQVGQWAFAYAVNLVVVDIC